MTHIYVINYFIKRIIQNPRETSITLTIWPLTEMRNTSTNLEKDPIISSKFFGVLNYNNLTIKEGIALKNKGSTS